MQSSHESPKWRPPDFEQDTSGRQRIDTLKRYGRNAAAFLLLVGATVGTRIGNHALRVAAETRPLLRETLKSLDLIDYMQMSRDPVIPPNYYQWHTDHRGKVPYPYKNWDQK